MHEPDRPSTLPGGIASSKPKRKYRLTRAGRLSVRAQAARRANLEKARAAPREVLYRATPKRRAASRANLRKAIAARKAPEGNRAARLNALRHGLFSRQMAESIDRLGESREEFRAHQRLFECYFAPEDDPERALVRSIAEATWRRLRLFRSQAHFEARRIAKTLGDAPSASKLTAQEAERRALVLVQLLFSYERMFQEAWKIHSQVERALRRLLRKKSNGKIEFKVLSPRRDDWLDRFWKAHEWDMAMYLLPSLSPAERAMVIGPEWTKPARRG
jgi:hypothetical protein